ncbi:MAG: hypothetical protein WDM76_08085 [Limisphaerales bacterium]
MDRTGIIVVSLCVVLLGVWFVMENKRAAKLAEQQWQFARTNIVATQAHTNSPPCRPQPRRQLQLPQRQLWMLTRRKN